jgi:hypothetical protein
LEETDEQQVRTLVFSCRRAVRSNDRGLREQQFLEFEREFVLDVSLEFDRRILRGGLG